MPDLIKLMSRFNRRPISLGNLTAHTATTVTGK